MSLETPGKKPRAVTTLASREPSLICPGMEGEIGLLLLEQLVVGGSYWSSGGGGGEGAKGGALQ